MSPVRHLMVRCPACGHAAEIEATGSKKLIPVTCPKCKKEFAATLGLVAQPARTGRPTTGPAPRATTSYLEPRAARLHHNSLHKQQSLFDKKAALTAVAIAAGVILLVGGSIGVVQLLRNAPRLFAWIEPAAFELDVPVPRDGVPRDSADAEGREAVALWQAELERLATDVSAGISPTKLELQGVQQPFRSFIAQTSGAEHILAFDQAFDIAAGSALNPACRSEAWQLATDAIAARCKHAQNEVCMTIAIAELAEEIRNAGDISACQAPVADFIPKLPQLHDQALRELDGKIGASIGSGAFGIGMLAQLASKLDGGMPLANDLQSVWLKVQETAEEARSNWRAHILGEVWGQADRSEPADPQDVGDYWAIRVEACFHEKPAARQSIEKRFADPAWRLRRVAGGKTRNWVGGSESSDRSTVPKPKPRTLDYDSPFGFVLKSPHGVEPILAALAPHRIREVDPSDQRIVVVIDDLHAE